MKYINTRTGIIFEASSVIKGNEIEVYEAEKPKKTTKKEVKSDE